LVLTWLDIDHIHGLTWQFLLSAIFLGLLQNNKVVAPPLDICNAPQSLNESVPYA